MTDKIAVPISRSRGHKRNWALLALRPLQDRCRQPPQERPANVGPRRGSPKVPQEPSSGLLRHAIGNELRSRTMIDFAHPAPRRATVREALPHKRKEPRTGDGALSVTTGTVGEGSGKTLQNDLWAVDMYIPPPAPDGKNFTRISDIPGDDPYGKAGDAIRFLQAFDPNGWHNLVAFDPFSGKPIDACTFAPGAWGKMADWINGHIEQRNLYFSVGEPKPRSPNNKLKKSDIARIRALFADLDPEGGAEEFEGERARIRLRVEELQRGPLPPSFVIDSGGGMQVFWKLDEPIEADAASQDRVENIGRAIAHALKADAVQNIDRIMRLPGTTNFPNAKKRRKGRTVRPTVLIGRQRHPAWH